MSEKNLKTEENIEVRPLRRSRVVEEPVKEKKSLFRKPKKKKQTNKHRIDDVVGEPKEPQLELEESTDDSENSVEQAQETTEAVTLEEHEAPRLRRERAVSDKPQRTSISSKIKSFLNKTPDEISKEKKPQEPPRTLKEWVKQTPIWKHLLIILFLCAWTAVIMWFVKNFVYTVMYVPSDSMVPTLPVNSRIIVWLPPAQHFTQWLGQNNIAVAVLVAIVSLVVVTVSVMRYRKKTGSLKNYVLAKGRGGFTAGLSAGIVVAGFLVGFLAVNPMDGYIADANNIKHGDIVVFRDTHSWLPGAERNRGYLVKRIVAIPGDNIRGNYEDGIHLNNKLLYEPYINGVNPTNIDFNANIPENKFFVMGDNRSHSKDSRFMTDDGNNGLVDRSQIVGKVAFMFDLP